MSIPQEIPMRKSRYTNGCAENLWTFPIMGALPQNPVGNLFAPQTEEEFAQYVVRAVDPVVAYFYCSDNPAEKEILQNLVQVTSGTTNTVVAVDSKQLPEVVCKYGWPNQPTPIVARLYRTHVMRFMDGPLTKDRLCLFANSTKQWRNKGFYPHSK